ncbi:MAG: FAD-dependent oxidoreductase, partial [Solirubrobacteraceae bacterium]
MPHPDSRVRIAIIGSGPAGAYAAGHLLRHGEPELHVDLFERLPTPWGLVRAGVAPDHPKIKSVTRLYERTAEHPRLRLFANIEFGRDVTLEDLRRHYHAIVYAVGTPTDRSLGIPGEDLPGSYSATDFVGWYNGHPDFCDHEFDLSGERAAVIGAGNVALDVARMLVLTREELAVTDIADHALDVLAASRVREVVVVARRGPLQAAFTNPELLELGELTDADVAVDPDELALGDGIEDPEADTTARRNVDILRGYAERAPTGHRRRVVLRFLLSPVELRGEGRVESVVLARNALEAGPGGR